MTIHVKDKGKIIAKLILAIACMLLSLGMVFTTDKLSIVLAAAAFVIMFGVQAQSSCFALNEIQMAMASKNVFSANKTCNIIKYENKIKPLFSKIFYWSNFVNLCLCVSAILVALFREFNVIGPGIIPMVLEGALVVYDCGKDTEFYNEKVYFSVDTY